MAESKKEKIVEEALKRFQICEERWKENRDRAREAIQFRDLKQWDEQVKNARENDPEGARPCLTLDKLNQYVNQVVNDGRQNRPAIKVRPVDDEADPKTAEIFQGIVRHIEDNSNADVAYDTGLEHATDGGFGYWRITTDYVDETSFEQDIFIKRVRNRFSVYLDPNAQEPDGSDAEYGFVYEDMPKDEFKRRWPKATVEDFKTEKPAPWELGWTNEDMVRVSEYFRVKKEPGMLIMLDDGTQITDKEDDPNGPRAHFKSRKVWHRKIEWFKLTSSEVLDEREWPGKHIPIIQVVGNEIDMDGKLHTSGLIRAGMDAQRMYNYSASSFVENVALAPKAPYIAADGQVEKYENEWKQANKRNLSVLRYKPVDVEGQQVPPPQRSAPPGIPSGWSGLMQTNQADIQSALGMYDSDLGAPGNETSGKAIMARQSAGDTGTFHYIDNLSRSIRHTGRILIDLIPEIYDTSRVARILGEDGTPETVELDPEQEQAMESFRDQETGEIQRIYNLGVGKYDVTVTTGPAYATKREEAAERMVNIVQAYPNLMPIAGDIMFRNMDWPGAEEVAERLKRSLSPEMTADEDEMIPAEQAKQQVQELQQKLQEALQGKEAQELANKQRETDIKRFEAETKRLESESKIQENQAQAAESWSQVFQKLDEQQETLNQQQDILNRLLNLPIGGNNDRPE